MAGMKVVVVGTDKHGNIDEDDLKLKAEEHSNEFSSFNDNLPINSWCF